MEEFGRNIKGSVTLENLLISQLADDFVEPVRAEGAVPARDDVADFLALTGNIFFEPETLEKRYVMQNFAAQRYLRVGGVSIARDVSFPDVL